MAYWPEKIGNLAAFFLFMDQFWQIIAQNLRLDKHYMSMSPKYILIQN